MHSYFWSSDIQLPNIRFLLLSFHYPGSNIVPISRFQNPAFVSGVWYPHSFIRFPISSFLYPVLYIQFLIAGVWYPPSYIRCPIYSYPVSYILFLISTYQYPAFYIQFPILFRYPVSDIQLWISGFWFLLVSNYWILSYLYKLIGPHTTWVIYLGYKKTWNLRHCTHLRAYSLPR